MRVNTPFLTLGLAAFALAVHAVPGATELLQFDRGALASGEGWRWFTGHFTHFDVNHLVWDIGVFMALGWACERESRDRCVLALALAAAAISAAVWHFQPQFETYRGLSGLDSALFGLFAGLLLRRGHRLATCVGTLALIAIGAKTLFELATASTLFAEGTGYAPVPLAHLVGLGAGLVAAFLPHIAIFRCTFKNRARQGTGRTILLGVETQRASAGSGLRNFFIEHRCLQPRVAASGWKTPRI